MQYLGWAMIASVLIGIFVMTARPEGYWMAIKGWSFAIIITIILVIGMKLAKGELQ